MSTPESTSPDQLEPQSPTLSSVVQPPLGTDVTTITTIVVDNIPPDCTDREFRLFLKFLEGFERATLLPDPTQTKYLGYARFTSPTAATQAVATLHGSLLDDEDSTWKENPPLQASLATFQLTDEQISQQLIHFAQLRSYQQSMIAQATASASSLKRPMEMIGGGDTDQAAKRSNTGASAAAAPTAGNTAIPEGCVSAYVGGIPHDWTEAHVAQMFNQVCRSQHVLLKEGTGVGKIAFVTFASSQDLAIAISTFNNYTLEGGRYLVVRPRDRPVTVGGRGGGGGSNPPRSQQPSSNSWQPSQPQAFQAGPQAWWGQA